MANVKNILIACIAIFIILSILEFGFSEARRGGRFGGYRSTRSYRSYRSTRTRTRVRYRSGSSSVRVRNRVRIRSGSSPYTRASFHGALTAGLIYGHVRYMRTRRYYDDPYRVPTICTNNYDRDNNGTVYGYFICPRAGEPENFEYCCGSSLRERCCKYFDENDQGRTAGIVVGVIIAVIVIGVIVYCVCKRTGTSGTIVNKFSSQKNSGPVNMVPVPTQPPPAHNYPPGSYPAQPPPPANNYAPGSYPAQPPYNPPAGYPTPQGYDGTGGQAHGDNGALPYKTNPDNTPYPSAPYPQPTDPSYGQYPPPPPGPGYPPQGVGYPPQAPGYPPQGGDFPPPSGFANSGQPYPANPPPPYSQ